MKTMPINCELYMHFAVAIEKIVNFILSMVRFKIRSNSHRIYTITSRFSRPCQTEYMKAAKINRCIHTCKQKSYVSDRFTVSIGPDSELVTVEQKDRKGKGELCETKTKMRVHIYFIFIHLT